MEDVIQAFVFERSDGSGSGYGYGEGSGYGYGDGSGYGYGDGSGYGYGYGSGDGYGSGYGDGYGYGDGSGDGSGYGSGDGIKSLNGRKTYIIDNVLTAITAVKSNIAKGHIVNDDLTMEKCYVVKQNDLFAHGKTIRAAMQALQDKLFEDVPVEGRIDMFLEQFVLGKEYPAKDFYKWHGKLTGSCEMGREAFIKNQGISLDDKMTVERFIELTKNDYGGDIIRQLKERINL